MRPNSFFIFTAAALSLTLLQAPALAEIVRIRTQFPSPYGSYGTMDAHGNTTLGDTAGGSTQLASGGGQVLIGANANAPGTLGVRGLTAGNHTAAFRYSNGWGVEMGGSGAVGTGGSIQANSAPGGTGQLMLNGFGGNIGIGTATPQYALHVNGTIGITRAAQTGPLGVSYDASAGGGYYGTYAP